MNLPNGALVAVADGAKLSLFRNTGHNLDIQLADGHASRSPNGYPARRAAAPATPTPTTTPRPRTASPWGWPRL